MQISPRFFSRTLWRVAISESCRRSRWWQDCFPRNVLAGFLRLAGLAVALLQGVFPSESDAGTIMVVWQDNASNETGYKIERGINGASFTQIAAVGPNVTSYSDTSGAPSTTYSYRVRPYNAAGNSAFSNVAMVTTPGGSPVNSAPTISDVASRGINEDSSTGGIAFTVSDVQTAAGSLVVTASSSNPTLVPAAGLVLGGSGSSRTLTATPAANQTGSATITLTVGDGVLTATDTFVLTVNAVNDVPTIGAIADRATNAGASTGAITFAVADVETAAGSLTLTATTSNATLVPASGIVFGGSGANRSIAVTPAAGRTGAATIAVTVSDGTASASDSFVLTVNAAANSAPTISDLTNVSVNEDNSTGARVFTVGDAQTAAGSLIVTATSSNTSLVPAAGLVLGGSGTSRTLNATPVANQSGTTTITVTVSDGSLTASDSFTVTVNAVNDAPSIAALANQTIERATVLGPVGFSISDVETAASALVVAGSSSNPTLVPDASIVVGGSGANRTLTVMPVATQSGAATITVRVSDGTVTSTSSFLLTVSFASQALVSSDIGAPALAGSTVQTATDIEICAGGSDIWSYKDQFHFARQQLQGDAELIVRVSSLTKSNGWAKAGLMFRGSLADNAVHVSVFVTPSSGVALQWRATTGGGSKTTTGLPGVPPDWLRLIRTGDTFYAFRSEDGIDWELVEFVTVDLPETAYAGLAVTSHNVAARTTAKFDQFQVD